MKEWQDLGFLLEITGDGSPSLRLFAGEKAGESMHHSAGAATETEIIYGGPIKTVLSVLSTPTILSVGLGLGYVEICVVRESIRSGKIPKCLITYELVEDLSRNFLSWFREQELPQQVTSTYEAVCKALNLDPILARRHLRIWYEQGIFIVRGTMGLNSPPKEKFNLICYDAFSVKTSPELWQEEELKTFLQSCTHIDSVLTTYACTGALKRALAASGYKVIVREGFAGKRNSTLAVRGLFKAQYP
ncbi:MAG: MnmC family methyltransferase [Bdellovibrionaceae bacterium]|nr:MnmC family methyltransferase [Pseudobdellovibrionaceae bacterium]